MVAGLLVAIHKHAAICINESLAMVLKNLSFYQPDYIFLVPAFLDLFYKKIVQNMKDQGKYEKFKKGVKISSAMRKIGIDLRPKLFKEIHKVFGGRLRKIVVGGAPLRPDTAKFFDDIGIFVTNGYGITECSPLVSVNRDEFCDNLTVGVKIPCVEVRIDRPGEDGNGEICVKGETVMLGYYKMPEETAKVLVDGWFHTGDLGNINRYGQITITGRAKNLVVLDNGKNVYPEEVENYIMLLPYVKEVVVSGVDDGEKTVLQAEVFLDQDYIKKSGEPAPDTATILADARKALEPLPSYKRVSRVVLRDKEFEKTTTNKIKRQTVTAAGSGAPAEAPVDTSTVSIDSDHA
jgi:long-chain acyl-CoA synthetase